MGRKRKERPSFINYMRSNFSKRLRIPPDFVKHFSNEKVPKVVSLEVSSGRCWTVKSKTSAAHNEHFLEKGWSEFVNDNSIEYNDTLLLKLVGESKLYVKVYGRSCCEKEKVAKRIEEKIEKVDKKIEEKIEKVCNEIVPFKPNTKSEKGDISLKKKHCDSTAQVVVKVEEHEDDHLDNQVVPHMPLTLRKKQEKLDFQARYSFKSDYPFFIYKLSATAVNRGFLTLPIGFAKEHFGEKSNSPTNMQFIDPEGRTWVVKYRFNSRPYIGTGWKKIVSANAFRDDYVCAFELVHSEDMKVKISILNG